MKEKNLKLIMELIFIFILPICLLCFSSSITVDDNFIYDSNGNYETSSKLKKLSFDNSFIKFDNGYKNVIDNFNIWNEEVLLNESFNINNGSTFVIEGYFRSKNYIKVMPDTRYYIKDDYQPNIGFYDIDKNYIDFVSLTYKNDFITPKNCEYIIFANVGEKYNNDININIYVEWANGNYVPHGKPLILYTKTDVSGQNKINYTIWGKIKNLLLDNLSINDSIILDIILCYTMLWFIMFVIWHFFYLFFDGLVHLFVDWKKRSE